MTAAERVAQKIRELLDKEALRERSYTTYTDGSVSREADSGTDEGSVLFTVLTAEGEFDVHITPVESDE